MSLGFGFCFFFLVHFGSSSDTTPFGVGDAGRNAVINGDQRVLLQRGVMTGVGGFIFVLPDVSVMQPFFFLLLSLWSGWLIILP